MSIRPLLAVAALALLPVTADASPPVNAKYAGTYSANNGFSSANVSWAKKGKLSFAISNSVGQHVGDISGTVAIRNGKGTFHNPEASAETLKFRFLKNGTMQVRQKGEFSGYAGMNVTFIGDFTRK